MERGFRTWKKKTSSSWDSRPSVIVHGPAGTTLDGVIEDAGVPVELIRRALPRGGRPVIRVGSSAVRHF